AYIEQGGANHINEQPHTYWARLFKDEGFAPFDLFRPIFWGNSDIEFWYQQNTFVYVKSDSKLHEQFGFAGYRPMTNIAFMDCVHPDLYGAKLSQLRSSWRARLSQREVKLAIRRIAMG